MRRKIKRACLAAALLLASSQPPAAADQRGAVDVVHFWISQSEAAALDV
ncbi:hypothetical protein SS05631_b64130 (plasmid) [Sinorhizobium sp. CCBAU 05631]|nr:hypothetical protein SS05631_b64130 [Sinorhizobium sp. CCBAU 05631]